MQLRPMLMQLSSLIHIYANGKHGEGKSHSLSEMVRLLPPNRVIDGDVSLKNLFYDGNSLLDAMTQHVDDINLCDGLASLHKKITTKFQDGAEHRTVIDGAPEKMKLPKRLGIWTSSVDIHGDEQYRDRWLDVAINEEQTKGIIEFMKEQDRIQRNDNDFKFKTEVCRYIYEDLAKHVFYVEIPYTDEFDFQVSEKTRGYAMFSDMIKGFAALRYAKRVTNELGHLIADPDDFFDAKELYEGIHGHSELKFGPAEIKFLNALIKLGRTADTKQMCKQMNIGKARLSQIANGRGKDEQKKNGLLSKCAALTVEYEAITTKDEVENVTTHKNIYTLDSDFKGMDDHAELITIKEKTNLESLSKERIYTVYSTFIARLLDEFDSCQDEFTRFIVNRSICDTLLQDFRQDIQSEVHIESLKMCKSGKSVEVASDSSELTWCKSASKFTPTKEIDVINLKSNLADTLPKFDSTIPGLEVHAKDVIWVPKEPEVTMLQEDENKDEICAVCGDELISEGKLVRSYTQNNGKFYCAQPGCGYPARGEVEEEKDELLVTAT